MNQDASKELREQWEVRIVAFLLGEASVFEADEVRQAMLNNPSLVAFHDEMRRTLAIVQDASKKHTSANPSAATEPKLSRERRDALLAKFKEKKEAKKEERIVPMVAQKPRANLWSPVLQVAALILTLTVLAGLMLPAGSKAKAKAQRISAIHSQREAERAKASENVEDGALANIPTITTFGLEPAKNANETIAAGVEVALPNANLNQVAGDVVSFDIAAPKASPAKPSDGTVALAQKIALPQYGLNEMDADRSGREVAHAGGAVRHQTTVNGVILGTASASIADRDGDLKMAKASKSEGTSTLRLPTAGIRTERRLNEQAAPAEDSFQIAAGSKPGAQTAGEFRFQTANAENGRGALATTSPGQPSGSVQPEGRPAASSYFANGLAGQSVGGVAGGGRFGGGGGGAGGNLALNQSSVAQNKQSLGVEYGEKLSESESVATKNSFGSARMQVRRGGESAGQPVVMNGVNREGISSSLRSDRSSGVDKRSQTTDLYARAEERSKAAAVDWSFQDGRQANVKLPAVKQLSDESRVQLSDKLDSADANVKNLDSFQIADELGKQTLNYAVATEILSRKRSDQSGDVAQLGVDPMLLGRDFKPNQATTGLHPAGPAPSRSLGFAFTPPPATVAPAAPPPAPAPQSGAVEANNSRFFRENEAKGILAASSKPQSPPVIVAAPVAMPAISQSMVLGLMMDAAKTDAENKPASLRETVEFKKAAEKQASLVKAKEAIAAKDQKSLAAKDSVQNLGAIMVTNVFVEPVILRAEDPAARAPKPSPTPPPIAQPEINTRENRFSTFSLNVSDVSFKLAGANLDNRIMPDPANIRVEEFINAFNYHDPAPESGAKLAFAWERSGYPFGHNRDILRFAIQTASQGRDQTKPMNLVILLDNSGSMERADRVQILQESLKVLSTQLAPMDRISVVAFARTARLWVDGMAGGKSEEFLSKVIDLNPEGGTNLEEALRLGYATARRHFMANGMNRVILLTDGAANLGNVEPEALKKTVISQRQRGIALDCFGIGWEGYNDDLLEVLSHNGDGRYGFLNDPAQAGPDFANQLAGALNVAAADVKAQVEFNPERVTLFRQIGYAKHQLTKEQFRDNTVDAAELAANESGNALYVVQVNPEGIGSLGVVRVRYKVPSTGEYEEQSWTIPYIPKTPMLDQSSPAMRLAVSAGAFGEWLSRNPYAGEITLPALQASLAGIPQFYGSDSRPARLLDMVRKAQTIVGK